MLMLAISAVFVVISCWIAVRANRRFVGERRLPMQWWLGGRVTWYAPRPIALAFMPLLAILTLGAYCWMGMVQKPRLGDEGLVLPALIIMGLAFLGSQLLHLFLIALTLRRKGR